MFLSPYSPFFTSGLLSEGSPVQDTPLSPRRGSLPTDSPHATSTSSRTQPSNTDESSAFYFMLQPRRDGAEFRSFLSLDLAESQSLRSASLKKRKVPTSSNHPPTYLWVEKPSKRPSVPLRVQTSRESLRNFPSRKPAPSSALPHVPSFDLPPRLPPISFSATMRLSSLHKSTHSAPSVYSPGRVVAQSSALLPSLPARPLSMATSSMSSRSATTQQRSFSRSNALACLEGRYKSSHRIPRKRAQRNFMSMSDDEDDSDDVPETPLMAASCAVPVSAAVSAQLSREKEDVVIPSHFDFSAPDASCRPSPPLPPPGTPARRRHRRSPTESWFPLASFMDVRDDDLSTWNWRSFIEVASVS